MVEREGVVGALHGDDRFCAVGGCEGTGCCGDGLVATGIVVHHAVLHPQCHVSGIREGGHGGTREGGVVLEDAVKQGHLGRRGILVHTADEHSAAVGLVCRAGSVGMGEGVAVDGKVGSCLYAQQVVESAVKAGTVEVAVQLSAAGDGVALFIRRVGVLRVCREAAQHGEGQHGGLYAEALGSCVVLLEGVGGRRGEGAGTGADFEVVATGGIDGMGGLSAVGGDGVNLVAVLDGGEVFKYFVHRRTAVCLSPRRAVAVDDFGGAVEVEAQQVLRLVVGEHYVVVFGHIGTDGRCGLERLVVEGLLGMVDAGGGQERVAHAGVAEDGSFLALPVVIDASKGADDAALVVEVVHRAERCVAAAHDEALALVVGTERGGARLVDVAP